MVRTGGQIGRQKVGAQNKSEIAALGRSTVDIPREGPYLGQICTADASRLECNLVEGKREGQSKDRRCITKDGPEGWPIVFRSF